MKLDPYQEYHVNEAVADYGSPLSKEFTVEASAMSLSRDCRQKSSRR